MIIVKRSFRIFLIMLFSSIGFHLNSHAQTKNYVEKWQPHVVAEGQTLIKIAEFYNTDIEAIRQANLLRNDRITAGQLLKVPIIPVNVNNTQAPTKQIPPTNTTRIQKHQVRKNETLGLIAQRYNVSVNDIAVANDITNIDNIPIDTQLLIPARGYANLTHNTPKPAVQQRRYVPPKEYISYKVRKGDTLSGIASRYHMPVQELANYNNRPSSYKVRINETLIIPNKYYKLQNNTGFPNGKY